MCGISGLISPVELTSIHIKTMTDLIRHRGPDGEGYVLFGGGGNLVVAGSDDTSFDEWNFQSDYQPTVNINETTDGNKVAFGHRRLSILDLSPCGHQPMSAAENRYWITFNGDRN
jgi:asparagine synthase (glutamine-hydrolysing)